MSDWLERELSRHLAQAPAPDGLWERLERPPERTPIAVSSWARWPIAAILTLAAAAGTYWLPGRPPNAEFGPSALVARAGDHADPSGDWALHCTLPARKTAYQVASLSAQRMIPPAPIVIASTPGDVAGCHQCHSTLTN